MSLVKILSFDFFTIFIFVMATRLSQERGGTKTGPEEEAEINKGQKQDWKRQQK